MSGKYYIGARFGRLVIIERSVISGRTFAKCICDCGNAINTRRHSLGSGATKSCGCLQKERARIKNLTHGLSASIGNKRLKNNEYNSWATLIQRCTNKNHPQFKNYGGRGIMVCKRWLKFENFFSDMGARPPGTSIDRIDNNLGYFPENCRWATNIEQARNRRGNRLILWNGKIQCVTAWSEELGITKNALIKRLKRMSVESAFSK